MKTTTKNLRELKTLSPSERRAVRAEHIRVENAEPYGWMAYSEAEPTQMYHLFCEPETHRLICTCADFIFRGDADASYECKHVSATLKHIGRSYLLTSYDAHRHAVSHAA